MPVPELSPLPTGTIQAPGRASEPKYLRSPWASGTPKTGPVSGYITHHTAPAPCTAPRTCVDTCDDVALLGMGTVRHPRRLPLLQSEDQVGLRNGVPCPGESGGCRASKGHDPEPPTPTTAPFPPSRASPCPAQWPRSLPDCTPPHSHPCPAGTVGAHSSWLCRIPGGSQVSHTPRSQGNPRTSAGGRLAEHPRSTLPRDTRIP